MQFRATSCKVFLVVIFFIFALCFFEILPSKQGAKLT